MPNFGGGGGIGISMVPTIRVCTLTRFTFVIGGYRVDFFEKINRMLFSFIERYFSLSAIYNSPYSIKKRLPKIIDKLSSLGISNITKSVEICTLATIAETFSHIPIGIAVDLSAICKV
jgi:hypothetical protein